jgi:hypothetical protein
MFPPVYTLTFHVTFDIWPVQDYYPLYSCGFIQYSYECFPFYVEELLVLHLTPKLEEEGLWFWVAISLDELYPLAIWVPHLLLYSVRFFSQVIDAGTSPSSLSSAKAYGIAQE